MREKLKSLRREIAAALETAGTPEPGALAARIDEAVMRLGREEKLTLAEKTAARKQLLDSFRGMDILQEALDDDSVTEIMVNGHGKIFLERGSRMELWHRRFEEKETLEDVIQLMAAGVNRLVNTSSPIADLRLEDGSRVSIVLPPAAPEGPVMTVRKFNREPFTMEKLVECGTVSREAADFLRTAVKVGCNIFISGGTSSGKTTFLNALSAFIPPEERVITIEDSLELQLQQLPNLVRLETRDANLQGENRITVRDLIRAALRMRPNRIIVGEVRGEEALDMLQAMNTGHRGSVSTGHANSAQDMLARLETMVLMGGELPLRAVRSQIASALDLLVHLDRGEDGKRRVWEIREVTDFDGEEIHTEPVFLSEKGKGLARTARIPYCKGKWPAAGEERPVS